MNPAIRISPEWRQSLGKSVRVITRWTTNKAKRILQILQALVLLLVLAKEWLQPHISHLLTVTGFKHNEKEVMTTVQRWKLAAHIAALPIFTLLAYIFFVIGLAW